MGYMKGTCDFGLVFQLGHNVKQNHILVRGLSDSDHGGGLNTGRSTSGWFVFLTHDASEGNTRPATILPVDWGSRRQTVTARSST